MTLLELVQMRLELAHKHIAWLEQELKKEKFRSERILDTVYTAEQIYPNFRAVVAKKQREKQGGADAG